MRKMTEEHAKEVDLVIAARWLIPVVPRGEVLSQHAVVVDNGRITDILSADQAARQYRSRHTIILDQHALIPGLINLHTHAAMTLMRGLADDIALMPWLEKHIWPAEKRLVSERFVEEGALLACAEMLRGGITCFNDMYFFPRSTAQAAMRAGIRAQLGLVVLEFPSNYANDADDYLQKGFEARDDLRDNSLLSFSLAPHAPYTIEDRTFERIVTYAEQLGLGIHTHLQETRDEIADSMARYGMRPIQRMAELGLLGPNFLAAHCVHLEPRDLELLANYGCHIAHCPNSNLKLGSGIAPVGQMLEYGINLGLGTDGAASNNRLDMFNEMRTAALLAKGTSGDATMLPAAQALELGTINAAKALGLDSSIGSIEIGKYGDFAAVRIADAETLPCFDPVSHLIYAAGREHVSHVWVAGELRYQQGGYAGMEPAELKEIASVWQSKLTPIE